MTATKLYYGDGGRETLPAWLDYTTALRYARVRAKHHGGLRGMFHDKKIAHRPVATAQ